MGFNLSQETSSTAPSWTSFVFDIVGKRKYYYIISVLVIVPGLIGMIISMVQYGSPMKLGVDFTSAR